MVFGLPFECNEIKTGYVIVRQNDVPVIEKSVQECDYDGKTLYSKFTQEETLKLTAGVNATISIVVKTEGGDRFENRYPFIVRVGDTAKDGVI
jgi:hypothetical protein